MEQPADMNKTKKQQRQRLAGEALKSYPTAGARTIARSLYDKDPSLWGSVESARYLVRFLCGQAGSKKSRNDEHVRSSRQPGYSVELPMSRTEPTPPVKVENCRTALILSDMHIPYHDKQALTAAIEYGIELEPDVVVLLGDVIDCYQVSNWSRKPSRAGISTEIKSTQQVFNTISQAFPDARLVWKEGNHEERMERFILTNAPQLHDIEGVTLKEMTKSGEYGIEYVGDRRRIDLGHLSLYHGHEFQGRASVHPARSQFLQTTISTLAGHCHRTSTHLESDDNGVLVGSWSIGCLCDMRPEYAPINKWNHGFAVAFIAEDQTFKVENKIIMNGRVL